MLKKLMLGAVTCSMILVFSSNDASARVKDCCNPCQVVIDNIRQTITLYKEGKPYELPVAFRRRLHEALRQQWKEKHIAHGDKP